MRRGEWVGRQVGGLSGMRGWVGRYDFRAFVDGVCIAWSMHLGAIAKRKVDIVAYVYKEYVLYRGVMIVGGLRIPGVHALQRCSRLRLQGSMEYLSWYLTNAGMVYVS